MAYKEMKLEPGEAKDLYNLWNAGMKPPKKKSGKKEAGTKAPVKKPPKKKTAKK